MQVQEQKPVRKMTKAEMGAELVKANGMIEELRKQNADLGQDLAMAPVYITYEFRVIHDTYRTSPELEMMNVIDQAYNRFNDLDVNAKARVAQYFKDKYPLEEDDGIPSV